VSHFPANQEIIVLEPGRNFPLLCYANLGMFLLNCFVGLIVKWDKFHHFLKDWPFDSLCLPHFLAVPLFINMQDSVPVAKFPFYFMDI
jgi:hypothetical protein